jgi:hypothetical protein
MSSLEEARIRADLVLTFRMLKGLVSLDFEDFFTFSPNTHTRGNSLKLKIPPGRLDPVRHSFSQRVPVRWNALPDSVVASPSLNSFKSRLLKVDLTSYIRGFDPHEP